MAAFKKNKEGGSKERDWSGLLPLVLILIVVCAIVGLVSAIMNISANHKESMIDDYVSSTVTFSVIGYGEYQEETEQYNVDIYVPLADSSEFANSIYSDWTYTSAPGEDFTVVYSFSGLTKAIAEKVMAFAQGRTCSYSVGFENIEKSTSVINAYNTAYDEAVSKATLIANSTGKTWRITKVEELESYFDASTGTTHSNVQISFAVSE